MKAIRKIPLEEFINILQDLYENGADFIDISGENVTEGSVDIKDIMKITVKPEYISQMADDIEINFIEETPFSDDDINDLI
jgi:hypothetical protein